VRITGISPLTGAYQGINYRLSRRQLGEILTEEMVSVDGRIVTTGSTDSKSSDIQSACVTAF
jgi:16S rRNA U516 pseudouridylate synthase RsuA-like enzyme